MTSQQKYIESAIDQLDKALDYLEYSYLKIQKLSDNPKELDQETLETWESFTARFTRVADIFMMKYIRAIILNEDPVFRGSLRDFMNNAAKLGIINDVEKWMAIRAIRNISAHEYSDKDLQDFFKQLKKYTPELLQLKSRIHN